MEKSPIVNYTLEINAPVSKVWKAITTPELIKLWLSDTPMEVISDWEAGSSITFSGKLHKKAYSDKGIILKFEPERVLEYTYLSSFSRLPYNPENYSVIRFELSPHENQTILVLQQSGFRAKASYEHANYYWRVALHVLKRTVESL